MRALSWFLYHHICKRISNFKTRWLSPFPNTFLCFFEALSSDSYLFVCLLRHRRLQQPRTMFLHSLFTALLVFNSFVTFRFFTHMLPSGFLFALHSVSMFPALPHAVTSDTMLCSRLCCVFFLNGQSFPFFPGLSYSPADFPSFPPCGSNTVFVFLVAMCLSPSPKTGLSGFSASSKTTRLMFFHSNSGNSGFLGTLQGFREPSKIIFHRELPYCWQSVAESDNMGAGDEK